MQPHYEMANTLYHDPMVDDCCSSTLHIPGPLRPNLSGHHLQQQYHLQFQQHPQQKQRQKEPCHEHEQIHLLPKTHQLCQHPHQFQASHQEQRGGDLLGGNGHRYCEGLPHYLGIPTNSGQPQEESTAGVSSWKAFDTVLSDAKGKHQQVKENERCLVSENNFGELEAVYILARNKDRTQAGSGPALSAENSRTVANVGLPLASDTATIGVDRVHASEAFFGEEGYMRRARKRIRKTKMEEEMGLMTGFFRRLVKRVMNQQEVLQNKFLEVIERMDKERAEREEAWRRQLETETYDREAIARAHERDLASRRQSSIVSSIEKITGQSFNLVSRKTYDQEFTNYNA